MRQFDIYTILKTLCLILARQLPFTLSFFTEANAQASATAAENPLTGFNMDYTQVIYKILRYHFESIMHIAVSMLSRGFRDIEIMHIFNVQKYIFFYRKSMCSSDIIK